MKTTHGTLIAGILAFASLLITFKAGWLARGPALMIGVGAWALLRWVGMRAAKAAEARRRQELEELRHKQVLRLDD